MKTGLTTAPLVALVKAVGAIRHTATHRGRTSHLRTWSFQGCCTLWWSYSLEAAGSLMDTQLEEIERERER